MNTARWLSLSKPLVPLALLALLAGCGYDGASSLPLPGAIGGKNTYRVTVVLPDATNLVAKETCRSNDTVIGSVESVELDKNLKARVVCRIKDSVKLPENVVASLSETSLLGERFVALDPPPGEKATGVLARNTVLPASSTRTDPDVEMVFGALSQVLNGGSLGSIETITRELNTAFKGTDVGADIDSLNAVVAKFNDHRDEISASLVSLDRLSTRLARQRAAIGAALDSIPGGLAALDRQRTKLVATLQKLSDLSRTAVPLIDATRKNTVADLKHLAPVLTQLSKAGDELATAVTRISTFPFPDNGLSTIKGDFAGFYGTFELDVDFLNHLLGTNTGSSAPLPTTPRTTGNPKPSTPTNPLATILQPVTGGLGDLLNGLLGGKP
ncbi:MCE family protein [Nocardioides marmorisolisilvae]|uniref:MCE family protein n=1 Tax=Nocardioides marmorisolisilvae TaxID=1542737 RepID=A0A3N0DZT0_9ACTN|nr:MCE family protein [Nocardioides marmorisolisilvae]RNL81104.1 MCE family protein [Nocardioides marmorisolisilvae]